MNRPFACILLLLSLAVTAVSRGQIFYIGDKTFSDPVELFGLVNNSVIITGNLTLAAPGSYQAKSWHVGGSVHFSRAGSYEIKANGGSIEANNVFGSQSGTVLLNLTYNSAASPSVNILGGFAPNVRPAVVDQAANLPPKPGASALAPLVNMSMRATLSGGQGMNPGFVVAGGVARRVLIRAVGPTLQTAFGVVGAAQKPVLTVYLSPTETATNFGWDNDVPAVGTLVAAVSAAVGAFALPPGSKDCAMVLTLKPGAYTAWVEGTGNVLFELYFID